MQLELTQLSRRYASTEALRWLNLNVPAARILVLIGPSGGGKSTLLRVIGGLEAPDEGQVTLNGESLLKTERGLAQWRQRNGFLFQQFNLFPHYSAERNISLPLEKVHGLRPNEAKERAEEGLVRFGLADHRHKLPAQLSGGQQQRVGLARAIAARPRLLLLDEPTSALDPEMTAEVLELVQELANAGQDVILSTHEMGFARAAADHVAFVAEGQIEDHGSPEQVFGQSNSPLCQRFFSKVMRY